MKEFIIYIIISILSLVIIIIRKESTIRNTNYFQIWVYFCKFLLNIIRPIKCGIGSSWSSSYHNPINILQIHSRDYIIQPINNILKPSEIKFISLKYSFLNHYWIGYMTLMKWTITIGKIKSIPVKKTRIMGFFSSKESIFFYLWRFPSLGWSKLRLWTFYTIFKKIQFSSPLT